MKTKNTTIKNLTLRKLSNISDSSDLSSHKVVIDNLETELSITTEPTEIPDNESSRIKEMALVLSKKFSNTLSLDTEEKVLAYLNLMSIGEKSEIVNYEKILEDQRKSIVKRKNSLNYFDLEDRFFPIYVSPLIESSLLRVLEELRQRAVDNFVIPSELLPGIEEPDYLIGIFNAVQKSKESSSQYYNLTKALELAVRIAFINYTFSNSEKYNIYPTDIRISDSKLEKIKKKFVQNIWPEFFRVFSDKFKYKKSIASFDIEKTIKEPFETGLPPLFLEVNRLDRAIKWHSGKFLRFSCSEAVNNSDDYVGLDMIELEGSNNILHFYGDIRNLILSYEKGTEDGVLISIYTEGFDIQDEYLFARTFIGESKEILIFDESIILPEDETFQIVGFRFEYNYVTQEPNPNWIPNSEINDPAMVIEDLDDNQFLYTALDPSTFSAGFFYLNHVTRSKLDSERTPRRILVNCYNSKKFLEKIDFLNLYEVIKFGK